MRQNKKRNQALDAVASVAKTWSEWRLGERAAQSVATGTKKASKAAAKARKRAGKSDSGLKAALKSTPVKIAGAAAVVGGVGAAVAKKLKGGSTAEPLYTPPPAPAPMKPPPDLKDVPAAPDTPVKVGDLSSADGDSAEDTESVGAVTDAGTESAVAASEQAATAATAPPPSGTEPTVPDTDPEPAADTTGDDEVEDAMDAHSDSADDAAVTGAADPDELEPAAAGDAHDDDAPTVPADDKS
jgi:hypothetical protein